MRKKIKQSIGWLTLERVIKSLVGLAMITLAYRYFNIDLIGEFLYAYSVILVISTITTFGIDGNIQKELSISLVKVKTINTIVLFRLGISFLAVFIILIPLGMYKLGFVTLAKLYFVNTDLIATIISFDKGPFRNIFKYLYNDTGPFIGYISQTLINWSVLIGLFALVLHEYKKGHISAPLSKVAFILLITYLLPGRYLIKLQEEYYRYAGGRKMFNGYDITGIKAIILGFLILILLISFEDFCIHKFAKYVQKIIHRIIKFIN